MKSIIEPKMLSLTGTLVCHIAFHNIYYLKTKKPSRMGGWHANKHLASDVAGPLDFLSCFAATVFT